LKVERIRLSLTAKSVAEEMGISRQQLCNIEQSETAPVVVNRSGKFPLVVQVLHKRRKKVVYTGFSIPDTLFDPVKGRVIDGGENTPESIRRINHRCESISRVLLKCISMIEKKSREYEIEDVFRTYGVLTHEAGFYFYFSRKIRELRESGH